MRGIRGRRQLGNGRGRAVTCHRNHTPIILKYGSLAVFDFYHNLNHFYGVLTDFCTLQNCPTMSAGPT